MFVGFTGAAYDVEQEKALRPGETMAVGKHTVRYDQPRMEADPNKRMIFTDMTLLDPEGSEKGQVAPAKFIYRTHPQMPTTEVAIRSRPAEDVYVIMSTVDPSTRRGTFRIIIRPLVAWIWIGGIVLLLGAMLGMWPTGRELARRASWRAARGASGSHPPPRSVALAIALATMVAWIGVASAQDDTSSTLHAGHGRPQRPSRAPALRPAPVPMRRLCALAARHLRMRLGRRQAGRGARASGGRRRADEDPRFLPGAVRCGGARDSLGQGPRPRALGRSGWPRWFLPSVWSSPLADAGNEGARRPRPSPRPAPARSSGTTPSSTKSSSAWRRADEPSSCHGCSSSPPSSRWSAA